MTSAKFTHLLDPWTGDPLAWHPLGEGQGSLIRSDGAAYPVTGNVARFIHESKAAAGPYQDPRTVESFGFQWAWDASPRTSEDLVWRVASRFGLASRDFSGRHVLDAGCGAGAQAAVMATWGAEVAAVDLSSAIDVAARLSALSEATLVQADLAHLPFPSGSFDMVYCEGVLQHVEKLKPVLAEFHRVLGPRGVLLATHYPKPQGVLQQAGLAVRDALRAAAQDVPRDWLFLASGLAAALAQVPGLGFVLRNTVVVQNPRMPTLKATWSATFDNCGQHSFQRYLPGQEFVDVVRLVGFRVAREIREPGVVFMEKIG